MTLLVTIRKYATISQIKTTIFIMSGINHVDWLCKFMGSNYTWIFCLHFCSLEHHFICKNSLLSDMFKPKNKIDTYSKYIILGNC